MVLLPGTSAAGACDARRPRQRSNQMNPALRDRPAGGPSSLERVDGEEVGPTHGARSGGTAREPNISTKNASLTASAGRLSP